jgi:hypothetical protein
LLLAATILAAAACGEKRAPADGGLVAADGGDAADAGNTGQSADAGADADGGAGGSDGPSVAPVDVPGGQEAEGATDGPAAMDQAGELPPIGAPPRKLDLVFVIDNSWSMEQEQENLARNFPRLMERLASLPGGLPDLRVAVLSSDLGAGPSPVVAECKPLGDRGVFRVKSDCGLDPARASWLAVRGSEPGNFQGPLPEVFRCLASLGVGGCGYEHHLQSLRVALDARLTPQNAGFLRDDAHLGVVILADEDDCSAEPEADFFQQSIAGHAGSLRCAVRGHVCNAQPVPATLGFTAPLAGCTSAQHDNTPDDRRQRLINVATFVNDIKALKPSRPDVISVSVIAGWDDSPEARYQIISRQGTTGPEIDLAPACSSTGTGTAAPGIRLRQFAQAFPRHTLHSICNADLGPAMDAIGRSLAGMM